MPIQELVFGNFLQDRRKCLKLTHKELAKKMGYMNISKGIRRIRDIENGIIIEPIISKLMVALNVTGEDRAKCKAKEDSYIQAYVNTLPVFKPVLAYRAMACIYIPIEIPNNLHNMKDQIRFAINFAREKHAHCCLKLDYNLRFHINKKGGVSKADRRLSEFTGVKPDIGKIL